MDYVHGDHNVMRETRFLLLHLTAPSSSSAIT